MQTHDALQRRNRYCPTSTGKRVSPKPRDLRWFQALADHGPLPSTYLHEFTAATHSNPKASRIRLTDLSSETNTPHGGAYLVRPPAQRAMEHALNRPLIYDLVPAAWAALGSTSERSTRPRGPFAHQLMVACVTASIELACRQTDSVKFLSGHDILNRSGATLGMDMELQSALKSRPETHRLVPDQLFALEYDLDGTKRYLSLSVECDRGTEPIATANMARKSYLRSYRQYRAFVGEGLYRDHYGLRSSMLVLNVMNDPGRQQAFMDLIAEQAPNGNSFMLFRTINGFGPSLRPPPPMTDLVDQLWERVERAPISLREPQTN